MQLWHVRVTPVDHEAEVVTAETVHAALAYLKEHLADGFYTDCQAFDRTGGYINMWAIDREHVEARLADYPLLSTIKIEIDRLVSLDDGFAVLLGNVERHAGALGTAGPTQ